ncbi:PI-PLC X domain-containing protein 2-like isoform X1 [Macrosteles quadrilineatus]|uniref:PI-PLC X domain-containing protein 2-like isoform X1 n=2 Tax=Macrosteles quadrilineatus TaxID=74068 RepID=UPI0023E0C42B|nr:PI-PLC X domain-containing protein 2-like isoform X1 [Macrosteles quadrilineatus]
MSLNNWMSQLDESLKNIPVINLAIPGSHDSMSYTIKPTSDIAPDNEQIVLLLARVFGSPSRRVIHRWCATQELTLLQQLNLGIRYLDLRISTKEGDTKLYAVHGLYGDEIYPHLQTLNNFLEEFPEEIIILDFQHFYNFSDETHELLISMIKNTFGGKLCPLPWDIMTVTLTWMLDHGYRVIAIYRDGLVEKHAELWPGVRWPTPWPQTTNSDALLKFLNKTMAHRPKNAGFVTQCLLTPDTKFVIHHPCGELRSKCSKPCLQAVIPWLKQQRPGLRGINVVITDFVEMGGDLFSKVVIGLNDLLLKP